MHALIAYVRAHLSDHLDKNAMQAISYITEIRARAYLKREVATGDFPRDFPLQVAFVVVSDLHAALTF